MIITYCHCWSLFWIVPTVLQWLSESGWPWPFQPRRRRPLNESQTMAVKSYDSDREAYILLQIEMRTDLNNFYWPVWAKMAIVSPATRVTNSGGRLGVRLVVTESLPIPGHWHSSRAWPVLAPEQAAITRAAFNERCHDSTTGRGTVRSSAMPWRQDNSSA